MYTKKCPICGTLMKYKSNNSLTYSIRKNCKCRICMGNVISEKLTGKKLSEEHKQKLSEIKKNSKLSEEHKKNIGLAGKGKKRSDESKKRYSLSKMGDKNPAKRQEVKDKIRDSVLRKYELDKTYKDRISKTLIKYFEDNPNFISFNELKIFEKFVTEVRRKTNRNKKLLLKNWDGLDYYDGMIIKENFNLHYNNPNYPTIDHKTSVLCGFKRGLTPDYIGSLENLCFTKRVLNNEKHILTEEEFKIKLNK